MALKKYKPLSPDPYINKLKGDTEFSRLAHLNDLVNQVTQTLDDYVTLSQFGTLGDLAYQSSNNATINTFSQYDVVSGIQDTIFQTGNFQLARTGVNLYNYYGNNSTVNLSRAVINMSDSVNPNSPYYLNKEGKFIGQVFSSVNDQGYNQSCFLGASCASSRGQGFLRTPDFVFGQRVVNSQYESMRLDTNRNLVINSDQGYAKLQVRGDFISFSDTTVGPEKVTNGDFTSSASWTFGTGWNYDAGVQKAYHNPANASYTPLPYGGFYSGSLSQNVGVIANEFYVLSFTVSGLAVQYDGYASGFVDVFLGGIQLRRVNSNGTFFRYVKAVDSSDLTFRPSSTFNGYIDSVSVKKVLSGNVAAYGLFTGGGTNGIKVDLSGAVGIGTTSPNVSSVLDVTSTTQGFLPPRMTTAQKNAIANTAGLIVFDTDLGKLCVNTGTGWQTITSV